MPNVQVFDPAMCCSTGVCGPQVDRSLVRFASALEWLKRQGITVERANLGQHHQAFAANPTVLAEINADTNVLPIVLVDGEVKSRGAYPAARELASWCGLEAPAEPKPLMTLAVG